MGLLTGCLSVDDPIPSGNAHLTARPGNPSGTPLTGRQPLGLNIDRDGFIYVPPFYSPSKPAALLVLLHGAGRSGADWGTGPLDTLFGDRNIVVIAPDSRGISWDLRLGGFGPDVEFIDKALELAFSKVKVDPAHIALGGFSDGASYAVSLGLTNGDLFKSVMGFSPGFFEPDTIRGKPRVFLSHGTVDPVLSYTWTSQTLAPTLRSSGYDVTFVDFPGGHLLPLDTATQAMDWFVG